MIMFFFKRKPKVPLDKEHLKPIERHKQMVDDALDQNKAASAKLKGVFERNHFTVTIALAMGAQQQTKRAGNHGH